MKLLQTILCILFCFANYSLYSQNFFSLLNNNNSFIYNAANTGASNSKFRSSLIVNSIYCNAGNNPINNINFTIDKNLKTQNEHYAFGIGLAYTASVYDPPVYKDKKVNLGIAAHKYFSINSQNQTLSLGTLLSYRCTNISTNNLSFDDVKIFRAINFADTNVQKIDMNLGAQLSGKLSAKASYSIAYSIQNIFHNQELAYVYKDKNIYNTISSINLGLHIFENSKLHLELNSLYRQEKNNYHKGIGGHLHFALKKHTSNSLFLGAWHIANTSFCPNIGARFAGHKLGILFHQKYNRTDAFQNNTIEIQYIFMPQLKQAFYEKRFVELLF